MTMSKRPRRNHSAIFKAKVALDAVRGDKTLAELAKVHDVHANQIVDWKNQLLDRAASVFGADAAAPPAVDLKELHAKIGQLALENDCLAGALTKAGMLSAKRLNRPQPRPAAHAPSRAGGHQPRQRVLPAPRPVTGRSAADEAHRRTQPGVPHEGATSRG
jgi:transposase